MKKHFERNWGLYLYLIVQIPLAYLRYKEIINCRWTYIMMPTWIFLTIILLFILWAIVYVGSENR